MEGVVLRANVIVNNLVVKKCVRFDKTVSVKEALKEIADKCSLEAPEDELYESYVIYVPANETREGKYLTQLDSPLFTCIYFSERDEIHVKKQYLVIIEKEGSEVSKEKVDLDRLVHDFFLELCKKYFFTPTQWDLCKRGHSADKDAVLDPLRTLHDQGVSEFSCLYFKPKKQNKLMGRFQKKVSTSTISGPMFVKHTTDEKELLFAGRDDSITTGRPIFGFPLKRALERGSNVPNREIPSVVSASINFILANALHVTGLFRISAKSEKVNQLKQKFDNNSVKVSFDDTEDPHLVCSIFKQYLRDLPEPIIPFRFYHDFLCLYDIHEEDYNTMKEDIIPLVNSLPPENLCCLKHIALFLHQITEHEEINKMNARNLATVFGPNLLHFPDNDDMQVIMRDTPRQVAVTSAMIIYAKEIFGTTEKQKKHMHKLATVGYVLCLYSYEPDSSAECEISMKRGDIIIVYAQQESGWWVGSVSNSNQAGFFPSNFCSEMTTSFSEVQQYHTKDFHSQQEENKTDHHKTNSLDVSSEDDVEHLKQLVEDLRKEKEEEREKREQLEQFFHTQLLKFSSLFDIPTS